MDNKIHTILDLIKSLRESQEMCLLVFPDNKKVQGKLEAYTLMENTIIKLVGEENEEKRI